MATQPRITVLGLYRPLFGDATVDLHLYAFRMPPGPLLDELRADVIEMLRGTLLVELLVADRDARFDPERLGQSATGQCRWDKLFARPIIWYLAPDGESHLGSDERRNGFGRRWTQK